MASSGVRLDLQIDDSGLQSGWQHILSKPEWDDHRRAVLMALGEDLVGEMKRDVPTNTSRLKGTIRALETADPDKLHVVAGGKNGVDYTLSVLHGSKPHAPGSPNPEANRSLERWARRNNYPGGFQAIYWSIFHHGTEPHDFVSDALERTQRQSTGVAQKVLRNRGVLE